MIRATTSLGWKAVAAALVVVWLAGCAGGEDHTMAWKSQPVVATHPAETAGQPLELVARFWRDMPSGVAVADDGRTFVTFPRREGRVDYTLAEIVGDRVVPFPDRQTNRTDGPIGERLLSAESVEVGPQGKLWVLDTGRPHFRAAEAGGPKLMAFDLVTDDLVRTIDFPERVALPSTYLDDVRFDPVRDMAYITDASATGPNGIVVVDLSTGRSWRKLSDHPSTRAEPGFMGMVEGRAWVRNGRLRPPRHVRTGAAGLAIGPNAERLYYRPMASRTLYSVSIDALADADRPAGEVARTVEEHGSLGFASDGMDTDAQGRLYLANFEDNAIMRWVPNGGLDTLAHDPRLLWPEAVTVAPDGYLYATVSQRHRLPRYNDGQDRREPPYLLVRTKIAPD